MKIQLNVDQYFLTLPKKIVESMEWKRGDEVNFTILGKDKLKIEKVKMSGKNGGK